MAEISCCARAARAPTRTNSGSESEPFRKHLEAKGVRRRWQWHPEHPFPSSASPPLGGESQSLNTAFTHFFVWSTCQLRKAQRVLQAI